MNFSKGGKSMYEAEISRNKPSAFLFLIDQSGSMQDKTAYSKPLSEMVADSVNKLLNELVIKCSKSEGVRDYFEVGVISYGYNQCGNGLKGSLGDKIFNPISEIANNPHKIEERTKKVPDGAGGIIEQNVKFPTWFEPVAYGGTPMCDAFLLAAEELANWCDNHLDSFPPIVINITDGEATDGDPLPIVETIRQINTDDGQALVFNVHITALSGNEYIYADSEKTLPNDNAKRLFKMSSLLTSDMQSIAANAGFNVNPNSRGYCYNADITSLINFLDIGTRASNLR